MIELFLKKSSIIQLCFRCNVVVYCLAPKSYLNPWEPMDCSLPGSSSMGFPRQEHWGELPFPLPGDLPDPWIKPMSLALAGRFFAIWATSVKVKVAQSCLTLCDPMDYTVHRILQARILEWVSVPFSRETSQPRDQTQVSRIAGRFFTSWATREAQEYWSG